MMILFLMQHEGDFSFKEAWFHLSDEYPIKYERDRLPPSIVADLNGDGKMEVLVATHDAKIQKPKIIKNDAGSSRTREKAVASSGILVTPKSTRKMAFLNKFETVLSQSASASSAMNGHSSMLSAVRCISSKLFVGDLSYQTDDQSLKEAFSSFGDVVEAKVITSREDGRSRGFGFVSYTNEESTNSALSTMDGHELNERRIRVSLAQERAPRSSFNSGGGFGNRGDDGGF